MFKQFVEINSTSLLCQFADISENERKLLFEKYGEKIKLIKLTDYVGMPANVGCIVDDF